jgi:hypothetical protein
MSLPGSDYSLRGFIAAAEKFGLPVKALRFVEDNARLVSSDSRDSEDYRPFRQRLRLSRDTLSALSALAPEFPSEAVEVQIVYHESTHAYLDIKSKDDGDLQRAMVKWAIQYDDAPLEDGSKGDDPTRLVTEAAAEYVGHRASTYWSALESMNYVEAQQKKNKASGRAFWDFFQRIPLRYNRPMAERSFGYQDRGPFWNTRQVQTTKTIVAELKDYCDRVILEGRMPDQFARTPFASRYLETCRSVPGFVCRL